VVDEEKIKKYIDEFVQDLETEAYRLIRDFEDYIEDELVEDYDYTYEEARKVSEEFRKKALEIVSKMVEALKRAL